MQSLSANVHFPEHHLTCPVVVCAPRSRARERRCCLNLTRCLTFNGTYGGFFYDTLANVT